MGVADDTERALSYVKLKAVKNSSKGKDYVITVMNISRSSNQRAKFTGMSHVA